MNKILNKIGFMTAGILVGASVFTSCTEDIDDSNLYTFTGQTIIDYLREQPELTEFVKACDKAGMSDRLSAYGTYTCFAPTNDAMNAYLDSLYNDTRRGDHNMLLADESMSLIDRLLNSTKADSLCRDIVEAHVTGQKKTVNSLNSEGDVTMMGGNTQTPLLVGDQMTIDGKSNLITTDKELENGVVHTIDKLFYRSSNYIIDEMEAMNEAKGAVTYNIFAEALKLCGLDSLMMQTQRTDGITFNKTGEIELIGSSQHKCEHPTVCKMGYTVFAESDEVMAKNNIKSVADLIEYAKAAYSGCSGWYDYMNTKGVTVSNGTDYKNQWNALNMFLRYHILEYSVSANNLVYTWNELSDIDVYEYYRTMLPGTMFKVTGIKSGDWTVGSKYINRQLNTPTLTSNAGSPSRRGNAAWEEANAVVDDGIEILTDNSRQASNGYIHPIDKMLTYNKQVPDNVLNERMRFDFMALLDESMTNRYRMASGSEFATLFGSSYSILCGVRFPQGYFKNMVVYNGESSIVGYLNKGDGGSSANHNYTGSNYCWNDYQGDELFVLGAYDFAVKLPPVPKDGTYELRFGFVNNSQRTIVQFYLGNDSTQASMVPCDIPINQNTNFKTDATVGWTDPDNDGDNGAAVDKAMHNRGWMRGPNYFYGNAGKTSPVGTVARRIGTGGQAHIRRIITKQYFSQGKDYWLRCKTAMPENTSAEFQLDYIELVPAHVYNNPSLTEDVF